VLSGILTTLGVALSCCLIYLALIGWGDLAVRALRLRDRVDPGLRGAWGIALLIALGGPLNLLAWISPSVMRGLLALGLLAGGSLLWGERARLGAGWRQAVASLRRDRLALVLLPLVLALLVLQLGVSDALAFNPHDDQHAYLVFPVQMLEVGGMTTDPFNLRRLISSLGGQSFLHAFSLALLGVEQLNALERGVAVLALLGLIAGHARQRELGLRGALALAAGLLLLHVPAVNTSSVLTGSVGFYALLRTFQVVGVPEVPPWTRVVALALVASGISALKTSLVPAAGVFLVAGTAATGALPSRRRVAELAAVGALTALLMLPWMLDLYRSSGTLLYPLFGQGFHGSLHGAYPAAYTEASLRIQVVNMAVTFTEPLFAVMALLAVLPLRGGPGWRLAKAGAIAACLTALILVVAADGRVRYSFPFAAGALLFLVLEAWALQAPPGTPRWRLPALSGALALALVCGWGAPSRLAELRAWPGLLLTRWEQAGADPYAVERERLAALQASVPAGEALFARLARPFLLDYARNPIVVLDWPCAVSPLPGLSCRQTPDEIAGYLLQRGIGYLAYDYAEDAGFSLAFGARLDPDANYWERISAEHTYRFQDLLVELAQRRTVVYDEDGAFVLDLRAGD